MASIKVKFRPSTVADHEDTIYYQIIHDRKPRQLPTNYQVFSHEWNENRSMVTASQKSERKSSILSSDIMEAFEAWHQQRAISPNTISFYIRILRAAYNRAVEEEIIANRHPSKAFSFNPISSGNWGFILLQPSKSLNYRGG